LREPRFIEGSMAALRVEMRLATAAWREVLEYTYNQSWDERILYNSL
jgi:hypothetical protein